MVTQFINEFVTRFTMFQRDPTHGGSGGGTIEPDEPEESAKKLCLWIPIIFSTWVLKEVTIRLSKWAKKCKGFLKLFCWIITVIVIVITFVILVLITIVWWVYVCGEDIGGSGD